MLGLVVIVFIKLFVFLRLSFANQMLNEFGLLESKNLIMQVYRGFSMGLRGSAGGFPYWGILSMPGGFYRGFSSQG